MIDQQPRDGFAGSLGHGTIITVAKAPVKSLQRFGVAHMLRPAQGERRLVCCAPAGCASVCSGERRHQNQREGDQPTSPEQTHLNDP